MAIIGRTMVAATQLGVAAASLYEVPPSTRAQVQAMTLTNVAAVPVTLNLYIVPPTKAADATTKVLTAKSLAAGESFKVIEAIGQWLEAGGAIWADASVAASISMTASGIEVR